MFHDLVPIAGMVTGLLMTGMVTWGLVTVFPRARREFNKSEIRISKFEMSRVVGQRSSVTDEDGDSGGQSSGGKGDKNSTSTAIS